MNQKYGTSSPGTFPEGRKLEHVEEMASFYRVNESELDERELALLELLERALWHTDPAAPDDEIPA